MIKNIIIAVLAVCVLLCYTNEKLEVYFVLMPKVSGFGKVNGKPGLDENISDDFYTRKMQQPLEQLL